MLNLRGQILMPRQFLNRAPWTQRYMHLSPAALEAQSGCSMWQASWHRVLPRWRTCLS